MGYLLFCYSVYYPGGGWHDFEGIYETREDARKHLTGDYYHIVSTHEMQVCEYGRITGDGNPGYEILPLEEFGS